MPENVNSSSKVDESLLIRESHQDILNIADFTKEILEIFKEEGNFEFDSEKIIADLTDLILTNYIKAFSLLIVDESYKEIIFELKIYILKKKLTDTIKNAKLLEKVENHLKETIEKIMSENKGGKKNFFISLSFNKFVNENTIKNEIIPVINFELRNIVFKIDKDVSGEKFSIDLLNNRKFKIFFPVVKIIRGGNYGNEYSNSNKDKSTD